MAGSSKENQKVHKDSIRTQQKKLCIAAVWCDVTMSELKN